MSGETTALTVIPANKLLISNKDVESSINELLATDPRELSIVRVKLLPGGAGKFEIAGDVVGEFEAVVLRSHSINTFWTGPDAPFPQCFSLDGFRPHPQSEKMHSDNCKTCQYGGIKGKCKWGMRLYILMTEKVMPAILHLPVTSTGLWREYKMSLIFSNIKTDEVLTKFTAGSYMTRGGNKVTQVKEETIGKLSKDDLGRIRWYEEVIMPKFVDQVPDSEDASSFTAPPDEGHPEEI